jgi:iron-sulfur cluster assembly protein
MTITMTPSAAEQIKQSVAKFGGFGLKIGVKRVGCNGLAYTYDMAKDVGPTDQLVELDDAKLVVAGEAVQYMAGSQLDYVREGFKQMFTVTNPNVKSMCGCGESFNVD